MLGIFQKAIAQPPKELNSPVSSSEVCRKPTHPNEILKAFLSSHPHNSLSATIGDGAIMAYARDDRHFSIHQRLFCGYDDIYCLFFGNLNNLSSLIKQYGLTKASNEAMVVIEAYRTLRDRGPYPADQVVKDLNGSFSFLIFDSKAGTVFSALGSDGGVELFWGIAADGSVVISDDLEVVKGGCGRSFAPFPAVPSSHVDVFVAAVVMTHASRMFQRLLLIRPIRNIFRVVSGPNFIFLESYPTVVENLLKAQEVRIVVDPCARRPFHFRDVTMVVTQRMSLLCKPMVASSLHSFSPLNSQPWCMFHSDGGLMSFEHPMHKMKAMPRVDSEGVMCGASFNVDKYSRVSSMPRVGSEANWTVWESR